VASIVVSRSSVSLGPLETIVQTLNNCGPSSVASVLAYWRVYRTEAQVAAVLRADNSYWGMSPVDLPAYAQSLGLRALVGYGGTERLIKLLLANGFPVIASQYVSSSDPIRHYRVIEAYNDRTGTFVSADPYLGAGHLISYAEFSAIWTESDYRFQVIYPPSLQARLNAVLRAAGWNKTRAFSGAIYWEQAQMQTVDFANTGSWIWYNGYIDLAFDRAQLGQFRKAQAALASAARKGISTVLIAWVQTEIRLLARHG
jgi:predicted double-glycine peptidase